MAYIVMACIAMDYEAMALCSGRHRTAHDKDDFGYSTAQDTFRSFHGIRHIPAIHKASFGGAKVHVYL